jgi:hypothetical protein
MVSPVEGLVDPYRHTVLHKTNLQLAPHPVTHLTGAPISPCTSHPFPCRHHGTCGVSTQPFQCLRPMLLLLAALGQVSSLQLTGWGGGWGAAREFVRYSQVNRQGCSRLLHTPPDMCSREYPAPGLAWPPPFAVCCSAPAQAAGADAIWNALGGLEIVSAGAASTAGGCGRDHPFMHLPVIPVHSYVCQLGWVPSMQHPGRHWVPAVYHRGAILLIGGRLAWYRDMYTATCDGDAP